MKYTNLESIKRKTRSKLKLSLSLSDVYDMNQIASTDLDNDLIEDVIDEQESFLDDILGQIYILPLRYKHGVIKKIVDNLIVADLITYSFNQDLSQAVLSYKQEAYSLLQPYLIGTGIALPNLPAQPNYPGSKTTPMILQGESLKTISNNMQFEHTTITDQRIHDTYISIGVKFDDDNDRIYYWEQDKLLR